MVTTVAPGASLRLIALGASAATALTVVSGGLSLHTAHRVLAALAVPPLAALSPRPGWRIAGCSFPARPRSASTS